MDPVGVGDGDGVGVANATRVSLESVYRNPPNSPGYIIGTNLKTV